MFYIVHAKSILLRFYSRTNPARIPAQHGIDPQIP